MSSNNPEFYIDHEVRLRSTENKYIDLKDEIKEVRLELKSEIKEVRNLIYWLIGIGITSIILPIVLHHYNLV
jgi:hypothetical protein